MNGVLILGGVAAIAVDQFGIGCFLAAAFGLIAWWTIRSVRAQGLRESPAPEARRQRSGRAPLAQLVVTMDADDGEFVTVRVAERLSGKANIPPAPRGYGDARWLRPGEAIDIQRVRVPSGMIYVGSSLGAPNGGLEPCLIDPKKQLSGKGDFTLRQTHYWPSYSDISPSARRAYLEWLSTGREHPDADIGFVFLFFYGLERRVLVDAANVAADRSDFPDIARELRRLLGIYGEKSNSFRFYAGSLLSWLELAQLPSRIYEAALPSFPRTFEVPFYVRVALGQAAVDQRPIPAKLAFAWVTSEPSTRLRTAAKRCTAEFESLFLTKYQQSFGTGIVVPSNRTKLKFFYRPASSGFRGGAEFSTTFGNLPDVTASTSTIPRLQKIVEQATAELEPYSRLVGRQSATATAVEKLSLLPPPLWPQSALDALRRLSGKMTDGRARMTCADFLLLFESAAVPTRARLIGFLAALEKFGIGIEPDVVGGARPPKLDDTVIVFDAPTTEPRTAYGASYRVAELTLQIASIVAATDGEFATAEASHLRNVIAGWRHLSANQQRRLFAQLEILLVEPKTTAGMKKRLEAIDQATKETIAGLMVSLAHSDGHVSPEEVKALEKVYRLLGVDPKRVFGDVHAAASGSEQQDTGSRTTDGVRLDPSRVAQLQRDTEKVSALLADIFSEDEAPPPSESEDTEPEASDDAPADDVLGLSGGPAAFARLLLSRPRWSREDLQDAASDLELMLDGTIEQINEACFARFDQPLLEGDDPVELNAEIVEKIET